MDDITIPNALRVMMHQLFSNNSLKSWGVFPNQYGQICLNVRFNICEVGHSKPVETCAFRRVSEKQLARNASRIVNNNKKRKLNPTTPDTNIPPSPTHISHTTPELPRTCNIPVTPDNVFIHTPEAVSWISENPDSHVKATRSPPSPSHTCIPPPTPSFPSPPEFPNKTFVTAITQTEPTESFDVSTSVEIDSHEFAKCIAETDSDHDKPPAVDVICQNEHHIESPPLSKSCEPQNETPNSPPKPKPPDPKKTTYPYIKDGYEYYMTSYKGLQYLTRRTVHN
jgi:hypothetical protein